MGKVSSTFPSLPSPSLPPSASLLVSSFFSPDPAHLTSLTYTSLGLTSPTTRSAPSPRSRPPLELLPSRLDPFRLHPRDVPHRTSSPPRRCFPSRSSSPWSSRAGQDAEGTRSQDRSRYGKLKGFVRDEDRELSSSSSHPRQDLDLNIISFFAYQAISDLGFSSFNTSILTHQRPTCLTSSPSSQPTVSSPPPPHPFLPSPSTQDQHQANPTLTSSSQQQEHWASRLESTRSLRTRRRGG